MSGYRRNSYSGGRGNDRGDSRGSFRRGNSGGRGDGRRGDGRFEQKPETGSVWGNQYREKDNHPIIQGEANVADNMWKVTGFLNVGYDRRDDNRALDGIAEIAEEINNLLLEAAEKFGGKLSLLFQDKAEWEAERDEAGGGRGRRGGRGGRGRDRDDSGDDRGSRRSSRREEEEDEPEEPRSRRSRRGDDDGEERVPFNERDRGESGNDPEPEDDAAPAARRRSSAKSTKSSAKTASSSKRSSATGGKARTSKK